MSGNYYPRFGSVANGTCYDCRTPLDPATLRDDGYAEGRYSMQCPKCLRRCWFDLAVRDKHRGRRKIS